MYLYATYISSLFMVYKIYKLITSVRFTNNHFLTNNLINNLERYGSVELRRGIFENEILVSFSPFFVHIMKFKKVPLPSNLYR